jgi:hypothetical protein
MIVPGLVLCMELYAMSVVYSRVVISRPFGSQAISQSGIR